MTNRVFTSSPAKRARVPLFIGLAGPSGAGKTFSALRIATGIQRTKPGDIFVIDTEAGRALHYADQFRFQHVPFAAPFGPFDYLDALRFCVDRGASCIVIDSMSHCHEGVGGTLWQHEALLDKWCGDDQAKRDRNQMRAWIQPKQELNRFVQALLQLSVNVVMCFRAKNKIKPAGDKPVDLGMSIIADDSLIFEMTVSALLEAGCGGVPTWKPTKANEKLQTKLPRQFEELLTRKGQPLDENMGELMGRWAAGDAIAGTPATAGQRSPEPARAQPEATSTQQATSATETLDAIAQAATVEQVAAIQEALNTSKVKFSDTDRDAIRKAIREKKQSLG